MDVKVEIIDNNQTRIHLDGQQYIVPSHWFWPQFEQNWEPQTFEFFKRNLIKDTHFLDIGAWVGPTALIATRLGARSLTLVEPNPINFLKLLETQFADDNFLNSWTILNICLSDSRGFATIGPLDGVFNASSATNIRGHSGVQVMSVVAEDLLRSGERYSLIKIDIEGAEERMVKDLHKFESTEAAIWLSLHPPFMMDKANFFANLFALSGDFYLTDQNNSLMDWSVLKEQVLSDEQYPKFGTKWGNFFEVGLLPKRIFSDIGIRYS
jgi:FkbM family methyltransferase